MSINPERSHSKTRKGSSTYRLELALQRQPPTHGHNASKFSFVRQAGQKTHRGALAESAQDNAASVDIGRGELSRDKGIDRRHRLDHALFVFG
jgi:hypothetical protein